MKHQTNPLTDSPGGVTLSIEFSDGTRKLQPRIKYPKKYIEVVLQSSQVPVTRITDATNDRVLYTQNQDR